MKCISPRHTTRVPARRKAALSKGQKETIPVTGYATARDFSEAWGPPAHEALLEKPRKEG